MKTQEIQEEIQNTFAQIDSKMVITQQRLNPGLYQRISTYSSYNWFSKPNCLSPIECSLKGWTCIGKDELECQSCASRYICHLTAYSTDPEQHQDIYMKRLIESHKDSCHWKRNSSSSHLYYTFPTLDYASSKSCLVKRIESLLEFQNDFQEMDYMNYITKDEMNLLKSLVDSDCTDTSLILALFGWEMSCTNQLLECFYCARKISFRNQTIDALGFHKSYCLWRDGYKTVLNTLKNGKKRNYKDLLDTDVFKLLDSLLPKRKRI